jgi:Fe-S oxidoreductase/nitrate reductase gamma subunit
MNNPLFSVHSGDLPFRELYWNIPFGKYLIYPIFLIAFGIFIYGVYKRIKIWSFAKRLNKPDAITDRGFWALGDAFSQRLVLRELGPGLAHAALFFGFIVLFIGTLIVMIDADLGIAIISKPTAFYYFFTVTLNIFGVAALAGIIYALVRRYIYRSPYLENLKDDGLTLALIFLILFTGHFLQALRLAAIKPPWAAYSFASYLLALPLWGVQESTLRTVHAITWWTHFLLVMVFIASLPYIKLWHIFTGAVNLFFRSRKPRGRIEKLDLENEQAESFGLSRVEDFAFKQLMETDACIRCGRCQQNCPAYLTEKPLNPKKIILGVKEHMEDVYRLKSRCSAGEKKEGGQEAGDGRRQLVGEVISHEALWACTTCLACERNCPMGIEHLNHIIGMRQYLTLMESSFPREVTVAFKGMENNSNPWAVASNKRFDWAQGLGLKTLAEEAEHEMLFFVGCAGSTDLRVTKVARALVKIMRAAGVKFGLLGTAERCCGEVARRLGNEYIAQRLIQANLEVFDRYRVRKILVICPHCYNTFNNEYPDFGGNFEVVHHTQFIEQLICQGRLKLEGEPLGEVVYHDSCYLGRYNDIFSPPRNVLKKLPGLRLREAERRLRKGFCCGAGGGRMWMEEKIGKRINTERTEQLLRTGARTLAVACPYCLTMISDGIKEKDLSESHQVLDIAELVAARLKV